MIQKNKTVVAVLAVFLFFALTLLWKGNSVVSSRVSEVTDLVSGTEIIPLKNHVIMRLTELQNYLTQYSSYRHGMYNENRTQRLPNWLKDMAGPFKVAGLIRRGENQNEEIWQDAIDRDFQDVVDKKIVTKIHLQENELSNRAILKTLNHGGVFYTVLVIPMKLQAEQVFLYGVLLPETFAGLLHASFLDSAVTTEDSQIIAASSDEYVGHLSSKIFDRSVELEGTNLVINWNSGAAVVNQSMFSFTMFALALLILSGLGIFWLQRLGYLGEVGAVSASQEWKTNEAPVPANYEWVIDSKTFQSTQKVAAGFAKQLVAPLMAALGHLQLAKSRQEIIESSASAAALDREIRLAKRKIDQLSRFSGEHKISTESFQLLEVINEAAHSIEIEASSKKIDFQISMNSNVTWMGNREQIQEAIQQIGFYLCQELSRHTYRRLHIHLDAVTDGQMIRFVTSLPWELRPIPESFLPFQQRGPQELQLESVIEVISTYDGELRIVPENDFQIWQLTLTRWADTVPNISEIPQLGLLNLEAPLTADFTELIKIEKPSTEQEMISAVVLSALDNPQNESESDSVHPQLLKDQRKVKVRPPKLKV